MYKVSVIQMSSVKSRVVLSRNWESLSSSLYSGETIPRVLGIILMFTAIISAVRM